MARNEALRRTGEPIVVSNSPDVCLTGGAPVPYSILARFPPSQETASSVWLTEDPTFMVRSSIAGVQGDEAGDGGGVSSGTNAGGGWVHVLAGSHTQSVFAEESLIVWHTSLMEMNCPSPQGPGNTVGTVLWQEAARRAFEQSGNTNPEAEPETEEELAAALEEEPSSRFENFIQYERRRKMTERWSRDRGRRRGRSSGPITMRGRHVTDRVNTQAYMRGDRDNNFRIGRRLVQTRWGGDRTADGGWEGGAGVNSRFSAWESTNTVGNDDVNLRVTTDAGTLAGNADIDAGIGPDGGRIRAQLGVEAVLARIKGALTLRMDLDDVLGLLLGGQIGYQMMRRVEIPDVPGVVITGSGELMAGAAAAAELEAVATRDELLVGGQARLAAGGGGALGVRLGFDNLGIVTDALGAVGRRLAPVGRSVVRMMGRNPQAIPSNPLAG